MLRHQEYNDYIKSLIKKPNPERVLDESKVMHIQRRYKGFSKRQVDQILNRKKVNLCITELFCLIFVDNKRMKKGIHFYY